LRKNRFAQLFVPLIAAAALLAAAGPSTAASTPITRTSTAVQPLHTDAASVAQAGAEAQLCGKPAAQRTGPWVCGDASPAQVRADMAKRGVKVAPFTTGSCSLLGCWSVLSNITAEFDGSGTYGYNTTTLGETYFLLDIKLTGGQGSLTKPFQSRMTSTLSGLGMTGERMYVSGGQCAGGCSMDGGDTYNSNSWGPVPANQTIQWLSGYSARPSSGAASQTIIHQFLWSVYNYPGSWYAITKTPLMTPCSLGVCFTVASSLPTDDQYASWTSAPL
jgi:hypothetical protein